MCIPRTFWQKENEHCQKTGGYHLDTKTDSPLATVIRWEASIRSVRDPSSDKRSYPKHELLKSGHSTSDIRMAKLSLVWRDDHHQGAYANPSDR